MSREDGRKLPLIHTLGDAFGGYGGTSRGACAARLRVVSRFDQDLDSTKTYSATSTYARYEVIAANDIVTVLHDYCRIDVLPFYPPCQIFSAAHARVGRNDESNKAPLLAIEDLPKKIRLRLVTLEGTSSLIRTQDSLSRFHDLDLDPRFVSASNGRCLIFSFSVYHCPEKGQVVLYIL